MSVYTNRASNHVHCKVLMPENTQITKWQIVPNIG